MQLVTVGPSGFAKPSVQGWVEPEGEEDKKRALSLPLLECSKEKKNK